MRSESEIDIKIALLKKKALASKKKKLLEIKFYNCRHNKRYKVERSGNVGFCQNKEVLEELGQPVLACSCPDSAKLCKRFENVNTVDSIEGDLEDMMHSRQRCMRENPKLATMLWMKYGDSSGGRVKRFFGIFFDLLLFRWW